MRRSVLLTLAAVGAVIVLLGGAGLFAALSDTARSATDTVETGALQPSADLMIAPATVDFDGDFTCGTWSNDLTSGILTIEGSMFLTPEEHPYCLMNTGSRNVTVSVKAEELTDTEIGCTGDEEIYDPNSCGTGAGELSESVQVQHDRRSCMGQNQTPGGIYLLRDTATTPVDLGVLNQGTIGCYTTAIYVASDEIQRQQAQSDRLTWRFAWTGQV